MTKLCTWDEPIAVLNSRKDVIHVKYNVVDATLLRLWLFIFIIYTLSKCLRPSTKSSAVSVIFFDETACKIGRNVSNDTRSDAFCVCTKRLTSASVGFCPRARRTSPTWFAWKKRVIFSDNQIKERPDFKNKYEIIQIIFILNIDLTGIIPSPFVSKSIKASWNSPIRSSLKDDFPDIVMALKQKNYNFYRSLRLWDD